MVQGPNPKTPLEAPLNRGEHHSVSEYQINMGVRRPLLADFVTQAPVQTAGKAVNRGFYHLMSEAVFCRIVYRELVFSERLFSCHSLCQITSCYIMYTKHLKRKG